jgi:hypothetical protein
MVVLDEEHELVHAVRFDSAQAPAIESDQSQPCFDKLEMIQLGNCELDFYRERLLTENQRNQLKQEAKTKVQETRHKVMRYAK